MKKLTAISLISAMSCLSYNAMAAISVDGLYVKGFGGIGLGSASGLNSVEPNYPSITSGIKTTDKGALFGAAIGYTLPNSPISFELQAMRLNVQRFKFINQYINKGEQETDTLNVRSNILLLNAIYSLPSTNNFTPFFGGGVGITQNKTSGNFVSNTTPNWNGSWPAITKTNFAYDLTAGVNYQFNEKFGVSLAYQYLALGKLTSNELVQHPYGSGSQSLSADNFSSNNIVLGLSYKF